MKVIWGGNDFVDCAALLGHSVTLEVASLAPVRNHASVFSESPDSVAVIWTNVPILMAQQIGADTVLLHTDVRPLGIQVFDDAAGLHVGSSVLSGNDFAGCAIGIALG